MEDSKAAGRWETEQGGEYFAVGVEGAVTGRGADLLIIDDPHSEQDAMSRKALDRAYEWYTAGPRQRLQPGGRIVLVMTRWNKADLTGMLQAAQKEPKADQWEVVEFPAILPSGNPVWPEYWELEQLEAVKASVAFHLGNATDALTASNCSNSQYSGHTGLPDGRIAGNSTTSHWSALGSFCAACNIPVRSALFQRVITKTIRPPGCKRCLGPAVYHS